MRMERRIVRKERATLVFSTLTPRTADRDPLPKLIRSRSNRCEKLLDFFFFFFSPLDGKKIRTFERHVANEGGKDCRAIVLRISLPVETA